MIQLDRACDDEGLIMDKSTKLPSCLIALALVRSAYIHDNKICRSREDVQNRYHEYAHRILKPDYSILVSSCDIELHMGAKSASPSCSHAIDRSAHCLDELGLKRLCTKQDAMSVAG